MLIQRSRPARSLRAPALTTLAVFAAVLGFGASASALELNLDRTSTLDLGGRAIVRTDVQLEEVKLGIFGGGTFVFEKVVRTIDFEGGPVEITGFEKNGLLDVAVKTVDDDVLKRLPFGELVEPMRVEQIRLESFVLATESGSLSIDVRDDLASAPVPEPGAALLFGSGLLVASRIRRPLKA